MGIAQVLRRLPSAHDPNLLVGVETHDDAGVYRLTDDLAIVQTIDFFPPVVDDPFIYGQIAAANALSDVYAMGGTPKTALNLIGYPDNQLDFEWLKLIVDGGNERCQQAGVTVLGGHTVRDGEIKFGYAVTGIIHPNKIVTNAGARPGDKLVLTKPLGTGFVTTANKRSQCPDELYHAACRSMVHLNASARDAMLACGVSAATDVTGFGLAGHGYEMAIGSGVTLKISINTLPRFPGIEQLIRDGFATRASKSNREYVTPGLRVEAHVDVVEQELVFDAQTSGGLLISVNPDKVDQLIELLMQAETPAAAVIGEVMAKQDASLILLP